MKHLATAALVLLGLFVLTGCKEQAPPSTIEVAPSIRSYTVRGMITGIKPTQLEVRHEAIPTFVDKEGVVVGMKAMTMPFPLGQGVSAEGFAVDDAVMMTFDVDYARQGMPHQITKLEHTDPLAPGSTTQPTDAPATTQPADGHDHGAMQH